MLVGNVRPPDSKCVTGSSSDSRGHQATVATIVIIKPGQDCRKRLGGSNVPLQQAALVKEVRAHLRSSERAAKE